MTSRAQTDAVQLKFRVRESLRARLEAAARQRGGSLNSEITERLEGSFDAPRPSRTVLEAVTQLTDALLSFNRLQGDALNFAAGLPEGESRDKAMAIARAMSRPQMIIHQGVNSLLPPIDFAAEAERARLKADEEHPE